MQTFSLKKTNHVPSCSNAEPSPLLTAADAHPETDEALPRGLTATRTSPRTPQVQTPRLNTSVAPALPRAAAR